MQHNHSRPMGQPHITRGKQFQCVNKLIAQMPEFRLIVPQRDRIHLKQYRQMRQQFTFIIRKKLWRRSVPPLWFWTLLHLTSLNCLSNKPPLHQAKPNLKQSPSPNPSHTPYKTTHPPHHQIWHPPTTLHLLHSPTNVADAAWALPTLGLGNLQP